MADRVEAEIVRHALDRVPLSLIIDDSAALVNVNYFWMRDHRGRDTSERRWEDVPVVIPERFTREWAEWCAEHGVRGKFSVIPCPAGLGRIDEALPLFGRQQLESWLTMCRASIAPCFDITPEMLTHTRVLDTHTLRPLDPEKWEQDEWVRFTAADHVDAYIELACRILVNVGLPPQGVTSPGGFGSRSEPCYAEVAERALRAATGNPTPYYFHDVVDHGTEIDTPVWRIDRERGTAIAEIIACAGDRTGSWTGYGEADADYYITEDLEGGRLPQVIEAGSPCIAISHWQGMYGLHDGDRRGFRALRAVVERLRRRDPAGERTRWRSCSEIANYACMRHLATVRTEEGRVLLDLPVRAPELTLRLRGVRARCVAAGAALREVASRRDFAGGTFLLEGPDTWIAFDPAPGRRQAEVTFPRS